FERANNTRSHYTLESHSANQSSNQSSFPLEMSVGEGMQTRVSFGSPASRISSFVPSSHTQAVLPQSGTMSCSNNWIEAPPDHGHVGASDFRLQHHHSELRSFRPSPQSTTDSYGSDRIDTSAHNFRPSPQTTM